MSTSKVCIDKYGEKTIVKPTSLKRPHFAAYIGAILGYYDCSLYWFMAPILAPLFLPNFAFENAIIFFFSLYPIEMLARPMGSLFLGKIGDRYGRKKALVISMTGMGISTGLIGCLPTTASIGLAAPICLVLLRYIQKFFDAGSYSGWAIFTLEHSNSNKGYRSGVYCAFIVSGILLAAAMTAFVAYLPEGYWRIAYLLAFLTAMFGAYIRKKSPETPIFEERIKNKPAASFKTNFKNYRNTVLLAIAASGFFSALYQIPTVFLNAFIPLVTDVSTNQILVINAGTLVIYLIGLVIFGKIADKISIRTSQIWAAITTILLAYPLFLLLRSNSITQVIFMKTAFAILCAWFVAPYHAWVQELFQPNCRYQFVSLCYSIGSQLGAVTPVLALWIWKATGITEVPAYFIMIWAVLGFIAIKFAKPITHAKLKHDRGPLQQHLLHPKQELA